MASGQWRYSEPPWNPAIHAPSSPLSPSLPLPLSLPPLTICPSLHAVNAQSGVALGNLPALDVGQGLDGTEARVLGQSHGNGLQSIGECPHGILLYGGYLEEQGEGQKSHKERES